MHPANTLGVPSTGLYSSRRSVPLSGPCLSCRYRTSSRVTRRPLQNCNHASCASPKGNALCAAGSASEGYSLRPAIRCRPHSKAQVPPDCPPDVWPSLKRSPLLPWPRLPGASRHALFSSAARRPPKSRASRSYGTEGRLGPEGPACSSEVCDLIRTFQIRKRSQHATQRFHSFESKLSLD